MKPLFQNLPAKIVTLSFGIFLLSLNACGVSGHEVSLEPNDSLPLPAGTQRDDSLPNPVTFDYLKQKVLSPKDCLRCHQEFGSESAVLMEVTRGSADNSYFYTEVLTGDMPKGGTPLSPHQLEIVRRYINDLK